MASTPAARYLSLMHLTLAITWDLVPGISHTIHEWPAWPPLTSGKRLAIMALPDTPPAGLGTGQ